MIYQDPYESLDPRFRVRRAIEEPLIIHGMTGSSQERERRIVEALERVELTPADLFIDRYPHELSGGQRQRVAIAASLMLDPKLLLADEPVSMLDVSVRAGILTLLDRLRRDGDMGIVMITHDLSTAAHFADRIAVMYLGRIVEEGPARGGRGQPAASVHEGPDVGRAEARSTGQLGASDPPGGDAQPDRRAARMPVPPSLPGRRGSVQGHRPGAARDGRSRRPRTPRRLHTRLGADGSRAGVGRAGVQGSRSSGGAPHRVS